jgi:hypothetical protein
MIKEVIKDALLIGYWLFMSTVMAVGVSYILVYIIERLF